MGRMCKSGDVIVAAEHLHKRWPARRAVGIAVAFGGEAREQHCPRMGRKLDHRILQPVQHPRFVGGVNVMTAAESSL
jgi:hypothetical protein